jgi:hypothetical protein
MLLLLVHAFRQLPLDRLNPVEIALLALCAAVAAAGYARVGQMVLAKGRRRVLPG